MIREAIVTTRDADGGDHVAPMGVEPRGDELVIAPFKPSATLDNLVRERCAVVNYSDDVRVFAGCLTGRESWPLTPAARVNAKRLSGALAHAEVKVTRVQNDDGPRARLSCEIVHQETHAPFRGFNRAQAAVIELAILASRLHLLPWEKIEREAAYLRVAVDKTAGENERAAWTWLMDRIEAFGRERDPR